MLDSTAINTEYYSTKKLKFCFLFFSYCIAINPTNIYLFKVNNRNTKKSEICSKLTIEHQNDVRRLFGVFIANFEHISDLFLVFPIVVISKRYFVRFRKDFKNDGIWVKISGLHKENSCQRKIQTIVANFREKRNLPDNMLITTFFQVKNKVLQSSRGTIQCLL